MAAYPRKKLMAKFCEFIGGDPLEVFPLELREAIKLKAIKTGSVVRYGAIPKAALLSMSNSAIAQLPEAATIDDPIIRVYEKEKAKAISDVLETLSSREAKVLKARFGLDGHEPATFDEVGQSFEVTRERIRQIEQKAMRKLRHPRRADKLRDFTEMPRPHKAVADIDLPPPPPPTMSRDAVGARLKEVRRMLRVGCTGESEHMNRKRKNKLQAEELKLVDMIHGRVDGMRD